MRKFFALVIWIVTFVIVMSQFLIPRSYAQNETQCGDILENTFSQNKEQQKYSINMSAGDKLSVSAKALGDTLILQLVFFDPAGNIINYWSNPSKDTSLTSGVLSASGDYSFIAHNYSGVGVYTLYTECVLRNGTIIKPGEVQTPAPMDLPTALPEAATPLAQVKVTPFADVGFPGLQPVDFSKVVRLALSDGVPISATLTTEFTNIVGFTINAKADDVLDLSYIKLSGNLNLGLVVLLPKNQVYFQSSLVTSDRLNTRLLLPSKGQYTIGIFPIHLVEPAVPEDTTFEIIGRLNPK